MLSSNLFPVVGIGASAGGLDAFKRLLKAIPDNSGMAYILVQHLDPAHESILTDLLQKVTKIPVQEIVDNIHVEADHIYIIPSNKLLTATDGVLQLSERPPKNFKNMPIDVFFESLADVHQSHAIGVVLSGTATDGTLGLKAIKEKGGITFAQDPQSASYESMPKSAINAAVVDYILTPEKIPQHLLNLFNVSKERENRGNENVSLEKENQYKEILSLIRARKEVDFTYYKQATIRRRIDRRLGLSHLENLTAYKERIKSQENEQDVLYQDLLIPVTQFFRDPVIFKCVEETIIPALLKKRNTNDPLRIWIAGCSTGEEAYSVIMCIHEYLGKNFSPSAIQLFATDISEPAIAKARLALYKKSELNGVSPERLKLFFTETDGKFRVNKFVRDSCVFSYHNYLKDPPFSRMDLVTCRNSLIYMEPVLQKKALSTFHYALNENGILLLGKSESITEGTHLFTILDKNARIYLRKSVKGTFLQEVTERKQKFSKAYNNEGVKKIVEMDFQKNADHILLSRYAPAGVIINDELEIVQFRGSTGKWLELSPGKPNLSVLKMARDSLSIEIRGILKQVKKTGKPFIKDNIAFTFMGEEQHVSIEVMPVHSTSSHLLILFKDIPEASIANIKAPDLPLKKETKDKIRIRQLESELIRLREEMSIITNDQELSNEELQTVNEELVSGSEELQSLNEELETSKEETQTSNEELLIVNQELLDKNDQLNHSRLYAESIVTTVREPLIILNKKLRVITANRSFYQMFNTNEEKTEGKYLFELGNKQWNIPVLKKLLLKVLPEKKSIDNFEVAHHFTGLGERIMLLNARQILHSNNEDQSILLAIEDITEKRKIEKDLELLAIGLEKQVKERTQSLHEANIDLQYSNKNLEQFAYIASHDLQEPLRKIRTFSSLLEDRYNKDFSIEAKELVSKIIKSSDRMSSLIKQLLDFSKILHSENTFEKTDLNVIIQDIIVDFELLITEKNAVIHQSKLPKADVIPLQINQLFYNIMSNALKFSVKDKPPEIIITSKILSSAELSSYKNLDTKRRHLKISFKDNGIGFDQEQSEKIFLIFHRLHGQGLFSGTGIGLALCKSIVHNHQGEINATSTKDKGSVFEIILPITHKKVT